jgi:hypothetical protein
MTKFCKRSVSLATPVDILQCYRLWFAVGVCADAGGVDGNFDIDNPVVLWDIVAVTHEIGHNFNSRRTRCYSGVCGNVDPFDGCFSGECGSLGCFCAATGLPSGFPGGGQGCGTIMSDCHQLSPELSR